jgi:fumarate hydratase subunit beta
MSKATATAKKTEAKVIKLTTPLKDEEIKKLKAGDKVLLSGKILTGRDAAHKRIVDLIKEGKPLPFEIKGQVIYYVGPSPAKPGEVIGAAGPTTSGRMDTYAPLLMDHGLKGMIGKGQRKPPVIESMKKNTAVYFAATGGAGALIANVIKAAKVLAWEELGPEAVAEYTVEDFPLIVINDAHGNDLYKEGIAKYKQI